MQYRKDIDGLRTIAVVLVILNHAGFTFVSGGFIGVDVFFVLSGFLITSIIYPKIQDKTFEFGWFLSRRIRRLMPVLFVVMGTTALVFTFILLPADLVLFYKSLVSISLYVGNFFFWIEHGGYFAGNTQEVPLLHTWSLAVEEQYYFVWPLMLIFLLKIFNANKTIIISLLGLAFATWFSQWATEVTVGAAYYLLPTRFFELLAGSCLAMVWHKCQINNSASHHILSITGIALILSSAFTLNEHSSFPGFNALYPVIGTVLLIIANKGIVNSILSIKPIVYLGAISYSLYLWHWPILVFVRYTAIDMTLSTQIVCIVLTFTLSVFSYHLVEQRFRFSASHSFKAAFIKMYALPTGFFIFIASIGIYMSGFPERFSKEITYQEAALHTFANESRKGCHSSLRNRSVLPSDTCAFATPKAQSKGRFFIFGDSHANHLVPFFETLAIEANTTGVDYTFDRCLPIFNLDWGSNTYKANECKIRNNQAQEYMESKHFDYVVLAASWPGITTKRIFDQGQRVGSPDKVKAILSNKLAETIKIILKTGATPIIAYDTPTLGGKSPNCTLKKALYNASLNCVISANSNTLLKDIVGSLKKQFPPLIEIDVQKVICHEATCSMEINSVPLFRDEDHLNEVGAKTIANEYSKHLSKPIHYIKDSLKGYMVSKQTLTIITNLYPLPWQINRATFNKQQFELLKDDYNINILVPIAFPDWFAHRKEIKQTEYLRYVPYFYLPKFGRRFYSAMMFFSIMLHSGLWLRRRKPKKILASWAFPEAVAASWISKLFTSDFYFKVHGSDINLHGKVPARAKQIVNASKSALGVLSVSQALADEMIAMGVNKEKIHVIYNGVDHQKFQVTTTKPSNKVDNYILYVGNLKKEKGVIELLKGFAAISEKHPALKLLYAGPGNLRNEISNQAEKLNISQQVVLLGGVDHNQLPTLISQARVLALPSYNEGVPNVVLEAMACGTPVLTSNVGGIPEVVNEDICGKIISARSDSEVAEGLDYILSRSWDKVKIQQHSKHFSWQKNKHQLLKMLMNGNTQRYNS